MNVSRQMESLHLSGVITYARGSNWPLADMQPITVASSLKYDALGGFSVMLLGTTLNGIDSSCGIWISSMLNIISSLMWS